MPDFTVLVETVQIDASGSRQIGPRSRTTALLGDRSDEIEAAVREASAVARDAAATIEDKGGWQVRCLEVKFGLTVGVEAGVIVSRASGEASFEVTVSVERVPGGGSPDAGR